MKGFFKAKGEKMQEYKNYWKNYANFNDRTSTRGYWIAFLCNVIVNIILQILLLIGGASLAAIATSMQAGSATSMLTGFGLFIYILIIIWGIANIIPGLAIAIRRLHDTGKPWVYVLFALIPCVGWIILLVFLTKTTAPAQFSNSPQV